MRVDSQLCIKTLLMKKSLSPLLFAGVLLLCLSACKKETEAPLTTASPRASLLIGKWTIAQTGEDKNGNNILDSAEFDSYPVGTAAYTTFRSNNTGTVQETLNGATLIAGNFTWRLDNNDQNLIRMLEGDTISYFIKTLTPTELTGIFRFDSSYIQHFIWLK